jgi:hypothetical protein
MTNPIGSGILAALAMTSVALAGGNDDKTNPTAPAQGGVTAAPGKGITFTGEGFSVNLVNRIQVNFGYTANEGAVEDTLGVNIRRARTKFSGDAYKDTVHFLLQFEWADGDTSDVLDALILWDFMKSDDMTTTLRFGQGKTLYGTEATGSSAGLEFIDRALATMVFANERSRQAQVVGKMSGGKLRWNAGLLNNDVSNAAIGTTDDTNNGANELNWIAGLSYGTGQDSLYHEAYKQGALKASEELMWVGNVAIAYGQNDAGDVGAEYDAFNINAGGVVVSGHIHVLAEIFYRDESVDQGNGTESEAFGWQAQGSYTADAGPTVQWAGGVRLSGVHITDQTVSGTGNPLVFPVLGGEGDILELQLVVSAFYSGHNLKTQFGYTYQKVDPDVGADADNHTVELQSQIVF